MYKQGFNQGPYLLAGTGAPPVTSRTDPVPPHPAASLPASPRHACVGLFNDNLRITTCRWTKVSHAIAPGFGPSVLYFIYIAFIFTIIILSYAPTRMAVICVASIFIDHHDGRDVPACWRSRRRSGGDRRVGNRRGRACTGLQWRANLCLHFQEGLKAWLISECRDCVCIAHVETISMSFLACSSSV